MSESTRPGLQSNNPQAGHFDLGFRKFLLICQSLLVIKHNNAANIITSRCKVSGQD